MCFHLAITVTRSPQDVTIRENSKNINALDCSATGLGPFHYQWEKHQPSDGSWMTPSTRVVNIASPNLTFSVITEKDEGVYRRVVSDNATITVYGEYHVCTHWTFC